MKYLRRRGLENYINQYTSQELDVLSVLPLGTDSLRNIYTIEKMDRILSRKKVTYDYEVFTIAYNKSGYLAIFEKKDGYGYWAGTGFKLAYYIDDKCNFIECKSIK
jgi:hypothetical protein